MCKRGAFVAPVAERSGSEAKPRPSSQQCKAARKWKADVDLFPKRRSTARGGEKLGSSNVQV